MVSSTSSGLPNSVEHLVATALHQGVLSRRDHLRLTVAMLGSPTLTATDRHHINQVFDWIRSGRVQLAD